MASIEARGLRKTFGTTVALDGVDLQVQEGRILGLIGPNGAGKTTVFNLITGVYKPDSGGIFFSGQPIHQLPPHQVVGKGIARTFQNIRLFNNLSVLDNVKLALHNEPSYGFVSALLALPAVRRQNQQAIRKAMEFLELMGLAERAEMRAGGLPYGLARRLEIARALALTPKLLLLDEPAAGMNPDEIVELRDLILRIHRDFQLTIVLIEHRMDLVMAICPRLVVLNFGSKLMEGTQQEVQSDAAVVQAYLGDDYANVAG